MNAQVKLLVIRIMRVGMRCLQMFPLQNNRVIFNAYRGSQYSCNPKYLSEYLLENYGDDYQIIWAFNEPEKYEYLADKGIVLVKFTSLKRLFYEATAKISINNVGSFSWMPSRKNQIHVNTWHGGFGVKKCGLAEIANNETMRKTIQMSSEGTDVLISTSEEFDRDIAKKDLGFKKETLKIGYPRNDIIFKHKNGERDYREKICELYEIPLDSYIILYAPTWRYNQDKKWEPIDYELLSFELEKKYNRKVVILTRMHHLMHSDMGNHNVTIDVTDYPDMQELLAIADVLITDYSSCIWDYSIMNKPIYLYTPDINEYMNERGSHVDINEWGFPIALRSSELIDIIIKSDDNEMTKRAKEFQAKNGSYETGRACELFWKTILSDGRKNA